jgi:hypothetical protein
MAGQGLLDDPSRSASPRAVLKQIQHMGFVQVDTINVLARAHDHILHTRFDAYQPRMLQKLLERDRSLFEHWTHDASIIPTAFLSQWKHRFERYPTAGGRNPWWKRRMGRNWRAVIEHVRDRIEREGPLMSRDFEHERKGKVAGWWTWKPQKAALEYLWRCGELAVSHRVHFHKAYDLTHRVFDGFHDCQAPSRESHVDWACRQALSRLGVATSSELAAFFSGIEPAEARQWCHEAAHRSDIVPVVVESLDADAKPRPAFALPDWRERFESLPEPPAHLRLLSPFDPVVRDRQRLLRLFNFDYRFEAFVPAASRKYGYYVLPMLRGDHFVGRLDARVDRHASCLVIEGLWWEHGARPVRRVRTALAQAIERLAQFVGAAEINFQPASRD